MKKKKTSHQRFKILKSIDRRMLAKHIAKQINLDFKHVESVLSILIDEISKDIKNKGVIKIGNFGEIFMRFLGGRKRFNVATKEFSKSKDSSAIHFFIFKKMSKFIIKHLDLEKTYGKENKEEKVE